MNQAPALLSSALDRAGINARELSRRCGVAEGRISDYLSGRHDPGVRRLAVMLAACGYELRLAPRRDGNGLLLAERLDEAGPAGGGRGAGARAGGRGSRGGRGRAGAAGSPPPEAPTWAELVPGPS